MPPNLLGVLEELVRMDEIHWIKFLFSAHHTLPILELYIHTLCHVILYYLLLAWMEYVSSLYWFWVFPYDLLWPTEIWVEVTVCQFTHPSCTYAI